MRIALFTETFLPKIDGIVNTLCYLLDHLASRGHKSILFAPEGGPTRYADTPVVGLPGIPFPLYPELKLVPPSIAVRKRLCAFQPDIVHVLNPFALGLSGLHQARALDLPTVASYHTDIPGFAMRWGFGLLSDMLRNYLRWLHNQADLNLCPSRATQMELDAYGFQRTQIWSRGVDIERFHPGHRAAEWRERLSSGPADAPLLLFVGRLSPEKRIDWLRAALETMPQVNLAIVGDGPARPQLERLFANTPTVFTGFLQGHDLACTYAAADLFVFPAANETLGNVVLEAMASELPVIAPRSGGVLDHVVDGQTGLLWDPEDQEAFIRAIQALLQNPQLGYELGWQGRAYAATRSWERIFDRLLDDYAQVAARRQQTWGVQHKAA